MATVGNCRDIRRAAGDAGRCGPDLVAVRLSVEDLRCRDVLAELAAAPGKPCVVVLGPAGDPASATADAVRLLARIQAVATAALDRGAVLSPVVVAGEGGLPVPVSRLNSIRRQGGARPSHTCYPSESWDPVRHDGSCEEVRGQTAGYP